MIVNFKRAGRLNVNGVILIPGSNKVDPKAWLEARKHPHIQHKLDEGIIVEETDIEEMIEASEQGSAVVDTKMFEHLATLKVPQARQLVEETMDLGLLEEWQKRETRNQVKSSLKKQIELLKEPLQTRDRTEKRQLSGTGVKMDVIEVSATPNASDD